MKNVLRVFGFVLFSIIFSSAPLFGEKESFQDQIKALKEKISSKETSESVQISQFNNEVMLVSAPSGLYLRENPSNTAPIIILIKFGETVSVLSKDGPNEVIEGKSGNWFKVKAGDREGWMFSGFLSQSASKTEQPLKTETVISEASKGPTTVCSRRNAVAWIERNGGEARDRYNGFNKTSEKFRISSKNLEVIFYFGGQTVSDDATVAGCWVGYFPGSGSEDQLKAFIAELENSFVLPKGLSFRNSGSSGLVEAEVGSVSE